LYRPCVSVSALVCLLSRAFCLLHVFSCLPALVFFAVLRRPARSTLFPYTTLFRSANLMIHGTRARRPNRDNAMQPSLLIVAHGRDRKSTRLNSSHVSISYAVFCLKKKKKQHLQDAFLEVGAALGKGAVASEPGTIT